MSYDAWRTNTDTGITDAERLEYFFDAAYAVFASGKPDLMSRYLDQFTRYDEQVHDVLFNCSGLIDEESIDVFDVALFLEDARPPIPYALWLPKKRAVATWIADHATEIAEGFADKALAQWEAQR